MLRMERSKYCCLFYLKDLSIRNQNGKKYGGGDYVTIHEKMMVRGLLLLKFDGKRQR